MLLPPIAGATVMVIVLLMLVQGPNLATRRKTVVLVSGPAV
jgi:hypothetical protein